MIVLTLFTRPHNALVSSNANLGKKMPKNDATITRKKGDATVKKARLKRATESRKVKF